MPSAKASTSSMPAGAKKEATEEEKARKAAERKPIIDALNKAAAELKASMPNKDPTCNQLYERVREHFRKEDDMLRFVAMNWAVLPDVIPIADNGPGFYISAVPIRRRDCFDPVPHDIRVSKPIPTFYEVKNKLIKFEGIPTAVSTIVSRTAGRLVMEQFQKTAKHDMREDAMAKGEGGATMSGGSRRPNKGKGKAKPGAKDTSEEKPYRPHWWEGVLIVLGTKPTPGERAFFKWAQNPDAPVPLHLYTNGDVAGLNAAKSLIGTFEMGSSKLGVASVTAEWQGPLYRELIAARKRHDRFERIEADPKPFPGSRLIDDEPDSVQDELDKWCETPETRAIHSYADAEVAVMGPLGQTARELRDGGAFFKLVAMWQRVGYNIAFWANGFQEGLEEYRQRQKGGE